MELYDDTLHVQCSLWFIRRFHTAQIWVCVKRTFKLLGIDLAVFIKNVRIDLCDHIGLRMPCVALCGFDVAVIKFQLISRAGMAERMKHDIMGMSISHFESILKMTQRELKEHLVQQLRAHDYEPVCKSGFLYAEGTVPVLLVAHLDTVHTHRPDIICCSEDGRYLMSPYGIGGDDRAGVYMILMLMRECHCHILFCEDEELGGVGARKFTNSKLRPEVNYIVELDRRGRNDAVFYHCDNPDFTEFVCSFGFKENSGSFSDISVVAPHLKTAAVNISAGYFNEHRPHEMIDTYAMCENVRRLTAMFWQNTCHFPYKERVHARGSMFGEQSSLFAPMVERPSRAATCKLLMPLPEETRLYMGQHQIGSAPEYRMDRSGNLYMYLERLNAAGEAEGVFACDAGGHPPVFSAVCEGTRFLPVYTYEEAVERLENA